MSDNARRADEVVDEVLGEPGPDDLEQQYPDPMPHPPVRVVHDGPVMAQQLPLHGSWDSTYGSVTAAADAVKLLKPDPKRSSAQLVSTVAFRVGESQATARAGAPWPPNVPLVLKTTGEVWIAYNAADATVTAVWESWTR